MVTHQVEIERKYDVAGKKKPKLKLVEPAYVTVFLNGVLVQNRQAMLGTTVWRRIASYEAHGDAAPIQLQDHDSPVSFRNIWVRPLAGAPPEK